MLYGINVYRLKHPYYWTIMAKKVGMMAKRPHIYENTMQNVIITV